uniref:cellulase family glycosylhydrolase n=1 Tax=Ruminococcus bicirculans (ex Wegman et al. 2014) TaxID=1160721 RepID=UPI003FD7F45E
MRRFNGYMHGIDIGGWLSQCDYSKEHLDNFITEEDIKRIKGWGCDHVRVPVDYNIFQDENGFIESGFDYVQKCIDWCGNNGINMILDLYKTLGFFFDKAQAE